MEKEWYCMHCGCKFKTAWVPFNLVKCPKCGSRQVHRIDAQRGKGYGARHRRGICRY